MQKDVHREITPLSPEDSFLVFDRIKDDFDFPIHFHPEFELNFILNGKGVRRIVGDNLNEIENVELVLVGPNLQHGWEIHNCTNDKIHEITIQFHNDLWFEYHLENKKSENTINDTGNLLDYGHHDLLNMMPKSKAFSSKLFETFNIIPGSHDDVNYFGYLHIQFTWGKKMVSFYRHPEDDFRSIRATKNIMGQ